MHVHRFSQNCVFLAVYVKTHFLKAPKTLLCKGMAIKSFPFLVKTEFDTHSNQVIHLCLCKHDLKMNYIYIFSCVFVNMSNLIHRFVN